jgi:hypothetical protein
VEVVDRGLVLDLDLVLAVPDRLEVLPVLLDLDREAWADLADESGRCVPGGSDPDECESEQDAGYECNERFPRASLCRETNRGDTPRLR